MDFHFEKKLCHVCLNLLDEMVSATLKPFRNVGSDVLLYSLRLPSFGWFSDKIVG